MRFLTDECGATAVEYALFLALVAAIIVGIVALLGTEVLSMFRSIQGEF